MSSHDKVPVVKIKISGLSNGIHDYHFTAQADDFSDDLVQKERFPNPFAIDVRLTKTVSEIVAELSIETIASIECDLCLSPISKKLAGLYRLVFLQTGSADRSEEEVRFLGKTEGDIDLTEDARETLLLSIPIRNVCEPICEKEKVISFSHEFKTCESIPDESDWQKALKKLNIKFNHN
jgi:uncharacterized protein